MKILITGGGGFIGRKLGDALVERGTLRGEAISKVVQIDVSAPEGLVSPQFGFACDITSADSVNQLFADFGPFDAIFHLAAIASAQAEADYDLGMAVNLMGSLHILQAARAQGNAPVVVFSSTAAVHGGEEPDVVTDHLELNPQTSYGSQKAAIEKILTDMSRRGMIDGRGVRLPTVTIRPGTPNGAASGFMSSIFRDTLQGDHSNCPVGKDFPIWHSAPRIVVENILYAAEVDAEAFGPNRCINLPGRTDTIGEMIEAMTEVAGPEAEGRITWDHDPEIEAIVNGWRMRFEPEKALSMGFKADASFRDSVRWFLEDDISEKGSNWPRNHPGH